MNGDDKKIIVPPRIISQMFLQMIMPLISHTSRFSRLTSILTVVTASISIFAIGYLMLSPVSFMQYYNGLLFYPDKDQAEQYDHRTINNIPCQNVYFPSLDGKQLHGWWLDVPGASKVVLVSHGNTGNILGCEELIKLILQADASVFI